MDREQFVRQVQLDVQQRAHFQYLAAQVNKFALVHELVQLKRLELLRQLFLDELQRVWANVFICLYDQTH